ncbi:phage protein NinX family protein [Yersinia massiliensis]|uniref:phage protein NinX family protein n=1 Tax=Yersinia massiliensis TaxID=419257 RepID=UPI0009E20871|nr:phage protein NinX family protein [Yersinia massiliensis]
MMDYKKLSDMELNLLVTAYEFPKETVIPHPRNETAAAIEFKNMPYKYSSHMPVQRPEESFHLINRYRIAIIPHGKTQWMAYHENGMSITDRKPLRAAMIIYLMLMEGNHDGHN